MGTQKFYEDHGNAYRSEGPSQAYCEAPKFTSTPDNSVGLLSYKMKTEADNARIASERLVSCTHQAFARQAMLDRELIATLDDCQASIKALIERLTGMAADAKAEADTIAKDLGVDRALELARQP